MSAAPSLLSPTVQAGDEAWTLFRDDGRIDDDPATLSMRARLLSDRARHAHGTERQLLFHEAAQTYARAGEIASDLAGKYAWQADACGGSGDFDGATAHPLIQERILRAQIEGDPLNMELKTAWIALQCILAQADADLGRIERANCRLNRASNAINELIYFDPSNETWAQQRERLDADMARLAPLAAAATK